MAKLTPGMKQDWKHRTAENRRPMKRGVRLLLTGVLFVVLLGVLIWLLLPPGQQRTYFFAANSIEYDLPATIPLVHSSVAAELSKDGQYDASSFYLRSISLEDGLPPLEELTREMSQGHVPGPNDACILYLQAHTLRYDDAGKPHVVVATPTFLRDSLVDWSASGVLPLTTLLDWIQTARSPLKLILLDAGTLTINGRLGLYSNDFASALEEEIRGRRDPGLFVITSHDNGQKSLSLSLNRNSIFSQAVQEALVGKGIVDQSGDQVLTLDELYHHICVRVKDHIGDGQIRQTPRLMQGGRGTLENHFPQRFVCRYYQQPTAEATDQALAEEPAPPAEPSPPADAERTDGADGGDAANGADGEAAETDPRWTTLQAVWQLRDELAQPPSARGGLVWSPIDFAPQDLRRLDAYLVGYHFRLLFESGTVQTETLSQMQQSLALLKTHISQRTPVATMPPLSDTPVDNLLESWNGFLQTETYGAWSADLTREGAAARDQVLTWNYCVFYVPEVIRLYEQTGSDTTLADYQSLLEDIRDVTIGMLNLPGGSAQSPELVDLPLAATIHRALGQLDSIRRMTAAEMTIAPSGSINSQMADALRLIGYLQTSIPSAADRATMAKQLREFSKRPVPAVSFVDDGNPFLNQLQTGPLPRPSQASVDRLQNLAVEIAAAGETLTDNGEDPHTLLGRSLARTLAPQSEYEAHVRYHARVRLLNWRDLPQTIVREVPPLPLRFPVEQKLPQLLVGPGQETQRIDLNQVGRGIDFNIELQATHFPPGQVALDVIYDAEALAISFQNGSFDAANGRLMYRIDADGVINIQGSVVARLDREANARRKQISEVRAAQRESVRLTIPSQYIPPGGQSGQTARLDVSLPWAEMIELVVEQTGAEQAGVFYGERVQIPLFANRLSELRLGVINRSRIERKVRVALYPAVRPPGSLMPTGRIFSQQYHRKPPQGGADSQEAERAPWRVYSYERPKSNLGPDFLPLAIAGELVLPPVDQVPPPESRERGKILNEAIEPGQYQPLPLQGPPGPPGADGNAPATKVPPTDLSHGLLCVIEDLEYTDASGAPLRWFRWIEWVPRHPKEYLDVSAAVVPANNLRRLEMVVKPSSPARAFPRASWDSERLYGFAGIPADLDKVPLKVEWDWKWNATFDEKELLSGQYFGLLPSAEASVTLGATLNLDNSRPVERPILLDVASDEKLPTLRRAFREVIDLHTGQRNADASAGFEALRLDTYLPHREGEEKPGLPISVLATRWPEDRLPILLPADVTQVDWAFSISTDTNSFNYASEINPDTIRIGLLERGNQFESARPGFTTTLHANRSFQARLLAATADGQLQIACGLADIECPGLDARTYETFVGDLVAEVRKGTQRIQSLRIPVIIDKDPPTIDVEPSPLDVPVNGSVQVTIPVQDQHSGVKHLTLGNPGPDGTITDKPMLLEPISGNILVDENDPFQRRPQFVLNVRPEEFQWASNTAHKLRVVAVDRSGNRSKPLDLVVRVGDKQQPKPPSPMETERVIRVQVVFVNGRPATGDEYRPTLKELPLQAQRTPDGTGWIFRSPLLKEGTNYTLQSSARQSSGGIKSAETTAQATPASKPAPLYRLQFD